MSTCQKNSFRKVVVLFRSDIISGRQQLVGLFRYVKEKACRWQLILRVPGESLVCNENPLPIDADGLVFSESEAGKWIPLLMDSKVPVVSLDAPDHQLAQRRHGITFVNVDNKLIGQAAAAHLLQKGRPRACAFVPDAEHRAWSQKRAQAFQSFVEQAGIPFYLAPDGNDQSLANWLVSLPKPLAVMAAYDIKAVQVLEACRAAHLTIPTQVMVIGVDNDSFYCDYTDPTLTSVEPDFEREGYLAAQELDTLMRSRTPRAARTILLPPLRVFERESTAMISPTAILVKNALTFIKDNATKGIKVNDVVRSMHVSRRLADLRFGQMQGESINACIVRHKLEHAERLLKSGNLSIVRIADLSGFRDPKYLMRLFKKHYGFSMKVWRRDKRLKNPLKVESYQKRARPFSRSPS